MPNVILVVKISFSEWWDPGLGVNQIIVKDVPVNESPNKVTFIFIVHIVLTVLIQVVTLSISASRSAFQAIGPHDFAIRFHPFQLEPDGSHRPPPRNKSSPDSGGRPPSKYKFPLQQLINQHHINQI
jgi:hypothetical protein